jgi:hypothetical protein
MLNWYKKPHNNLVSKVVHLVHGKSNKESSKAKSY